MCELTSRGFVVHSLLRHNACLLEGENHLPSPGGGDHFRIEQREAECVAAVRFTSTLHFRMQHRVVSTAVHAAVLNFKT